MLKGLGMVTAMMMAFGASREPRHGTYTPRQTEESRRYHLDRAAAKRERKAEKRRRDAERA